MKKSMCLILALLLLLSVSVSAAVYAVVPRPTLHFEGATAICEVSIKSPGDNIQATLELRRGATVLAAWSDSGTGSLTIAKTYPITSGQSYSLRLYGTIAGTPMQDITVSAVCH